MRTLSPVRAKATAKRLRPFLPGVSHAKLVRAMTSGDLHLVADARLSADDLSAILDDLTSPEVATLETVGALVVAGAPTTSFPTVNEVSRGDDPDHVAFTCSVTGTAVRVHPRLWADDAYVVAAGRDAYRQALNIAGQASDPLAVAERLVRIAWGQWCSTCGRPVDGKPARCPSCRTEWPGVTRHIAEQLVTALSNHGCDVRIIGETINVAWDDPHADGWVELNVVWADTEWPFALIYVEEPAGELDEFQPYELELDVPDAPEVTDRYIDQLVEMLRDVNEQAAAEVDA